MSECAGRGEKCPGFQVAIILSCLALGSCGEVTTPTATGSVRFIVSTVGEDKDPDGYSLTIDQTLVLSVQTSQTITIDDLAVGDHEVSLADVSSNCAINGPNPRIIHVLAGESIEVTMDLSCNTLFIAFVSDRGGQGDLYLIKPDGTGIRRLTAGDWSAWSPRHDRLAFVLDELDPLLYGLYTIGVDGTGLTKLDLGAVVPGTSAPSWSPDGAMIAFASLAGHADIYVVSIDGSGLTNLTNRPNFDTRPAWSPDGRQIAFESNCPEPFGTCGNTEIHVMNADGTNITNLTQGTDIFLDNIQSAWSPDGNRIVFASNWDGAWDIHIMNADGSNRTNLTMGSPSEEAQPTWSPDGMGIAYVSWRNGNTDVFVMAPDGSGERQLTTNPSNDFRPAWGP